LQAFLLAALVLTDFVRVWHLVVLSLVLSAVTAFDLPVRQAFLGDMLDDRADLSNAIALNAVVFNSARVVGPSLAAAIMYFAGEGGCFLLNGLSYLAVIASLLAMRRPAPSAGTRRHGHFVRELADGYRYAFGHPVIRTLLALVSVVSLLAVPYIVVLPVFVREVLDGGSEVPGLLMAGAGLGALCGSLFLASRLDIREALPRVSAAVGIAGVGLVAFSVTDRAWAAAAALFVVGAGVVLTLASSNTLIQAVVADDKRGRVLSLYTMAFLGLNPLGSMLAGQLMAVFGPGGTLRVGGVGCLLAAAVLAARLRPLGRLVEGDLSKKEADGSL
jgi:MFS family permease